VGSNEAIQSSSVSNPLSQLATNYQNTLNDMSAEALDQGTDPTPLDQMRRDAPFLGFLSREDSLIDLAMIDNNTDEQSPALEAPPAREDPDEDSDGAFNFIDFPSLDAYPPETKSSSGTAS
jgi:hypothetical protein